MNNIKSSFVVALWAVFFSVIAAVAAEPATKPITPSITAEIRGPHSRVELVSEFNQIQQGKTVRIGIAYELEPGWHIYWRNPGDSGSPPNPKWTLPQGVTVGPLHWPAPERISQPPLVSYGYSESVLLVADLSVPKDVAQEVLVQLNLRWLECKDVCIPAKGQAELKIPVTEGTLTASPLAPWFARTEKLWPQMNTALYRFAAVEKAGAYEFVVPRTAGALAEGLGQKSSGARYDFYPDTQGMVASSGEVVEISPDPQGYLVRLKKMGEDRMDQSGSLGGVLTVESGEKNTDSFEVSLVIKPPVIFLEAVLLAFLGGLILNLMPCVFPILSIKAMKLVNMAAGELKEARFLSGVYLLGVMVSFWTLAGTLIILRSGGQKLGWGFQLQNASFVSVLATFLFAVGLNFVGVLALEGSSLAHVANLGENLTRKSNWAGSFFTGVLAVVVATPCTAPFMGAALGYAATQPAWIALTVFSFLGLGMALPFVVLSWVPRLQRALPRPGPWMDHFKQGMGFPVFLTAIWLLWVLMLQTNSHAGTMVLVIWTGIAFFAWIGTKMMSPRARTIFILVVGTLIAISGWLPARTGYRENIAFAGKGPWRPFVRSEVDERIAAGDRVFVDATAAWCVTCQVNKTVALERAEVIERFTSLNVKLFRADWTNGDPEITRLLREFGRDGVPLYLYYPGGMVSSPVVLPQILTTGILLDAVK